MIKNIEKLKNAECYLFDLDGTIYLEKTLIEGALETVELLRKRGKRVIFLTNNSSVSADYYGKKISDIGIPCNISDIYTSGNATVRYLNKYKAGKSVYLVGTQSLKREFISGGITLTEDAPEIVVLSYDKELTYNKLVLATRYLTFGAEYIATHPDINCPATPVYEPDIGSFIELINKSCGRYPDVICGKPYRPIAEGIADMCRLPFNKIAMVGDRLSTDIKFGLNNGLISTLVLSGETTAEDLRKSEVTPDVVLNSVKDIISVLQ